MAVGDVFRVALVGGLFQQEIVGVYHYQQTTNNTSGLTEVESLARAFGAQVWPDIKAMQTTDMQYGFVEARTFVLPGGMLLGYDLLLSGVGDQDAPCLPPSVAVVLRKKTARLGRKYRGRNYITAIPVAWVEAGAVKTSGSGPTFIAAAAVALLASIVWTTSGSPTFVPGIGAYDRDPAPPHAPTAVRFQPLNATSYDVILRQQRRREIGVGA